MKHTIMATMIAIALSGCDSNTGTTALEIDPTTRSAGVLVATDEASLTRHFQQTQSSEDNSIDEDGGSFPTSEDSAEIAESSSADSSSSNSGSSAVSTTNLQEDGVDEADLIKVDSSGRYIYSVGNRVTAFEDEENTYYKPSTPSGIRVMDTSSGEAIEIQTLGTETDNWQLSGIYLNETQDQLLALSSSGNDYWGNWFYPSYFSNKNTDVLFIDVEDPANAAVADTLHLDGSLVASRRVGQVLYLVMRHYPEVYATESSTDTASSAADYLPKYSLNDGEQTAAVSPSECYLQDNSSGDGNVITLVAVDLSAETPTFESQCYVGSAEALYASTNALYIATTRYDYNWGYSDASYNDSITTDIHKFAFDDLDFDYRGSAEVEGHLGWQQDRKSFRFNEKDGRLRVLTFDEDMWGGIAINDIALDPDDTEISEASAAVDSNTTQVEDSESTETSPVRLTILEESSTQNALIKIAELPNATRPDPIGLPGEQLYASRYIGDRAYLVTFRVTDPLYVLDLSTPTDPFIAGELKVDGYSDYLHPITDTLLLGVGKDAIAATTSWGDGRGAWYQGVKLSLIDVSNPNNPLETAKVVLGGRGTDATVLNNHHGITGLFKNDNYRVALPVELHSRPPTYSSNGEPWGYKQYTHTGLYRFNIDPDNQTIETVAPLIVNDYNSNNYEYSVENDRSVIVNDTVHYMHRGQFWTQDWAGTQSALGPN